MASIIPDGGAKQPKKNDFTEDLVDIMGKAAIGMAITIGIRLGLIKDLSERDCPATVGDIASSTGLKERYVKEWCAAMATGDILEVSPDGEKYFLPVSKRGALLGNNAIAMHALFMINSFPNFIGADHLGKLMKVMKANGPSGLEFEPAVATEEGMYTSSMQLEITLMNEMLDGDPDLTAQLESGITVLELGCNTGMLSLELAGRYPSSKFCGVDIDSVAISKACEAARASNLTNTTFCVQDITNFPSDWADKFDYVFAFKVIHDVGAPRDALKQAWNVLKKGRKFSLFEYNLSSNPAENLHIKQSPGIYLGSLAHCIPYSVGLNNGEGLGAAWGITMMKSYIQNAGFKNIDIVDPNSFPLGHVVGYK